jgi:membrane protease YdiL (CAAX protease family)
LLLTGIVHATALDVRFGDVDELTSEIISQVWRQILLVEAIDSVIVAIAFVALIGTPLPAFKRARGPAWVWLVSLPTLAAMLALNGAYHELLRDFVRFPMIESEVRDEPSWLSFFAGCVQPAIVEEAYFRGVALSILRNYVGRHAAVWISATMFGLAHVSIALSIPYLVLFGVFVGYVRVGTGTIWLPMVLHFIHNLLVTLEEWT